MTKIAIIDFRSDRRERLHDALRSTGLEITSVRNAHDLALDQDLILLHAGSEQQVRGPDSIERVLVRFLGRSWILCYSGGELVEAARTCKAKEVAIFPAPVPMDEPGADFVTVIQKVLGMLPERASLSEDLFRSTVTGFDALLEAKLDVLAAVLSSKEPAKAHLTVLREVFANAFEEDESLRVKPGDVSSIGALRRCFFSEELSGYHK